MSVFEERAKINWYVALFLAALAATAWCQPSVAGSDLWWHLAAGRDILAMLPDFPKEDLYSYTFGGERWLNPEWFWAVLYWAVYAIQPQGVAWLNFAVIFSVFALAFVAASRTSESALGAAFAVVLAGTAAHWFIDIRPHLFTLLLLGIFLVTRDRSWAPWLWPALVLFWVNTHGGFVFGIGAIGLHVLVMSIRRAWAARHRDLPWLERLDIPKREWIAVAACFVAMTINPYGIFVLEYPIDYLNADSPFRSIVEWMPPAWIFNAQDRDLIFDLGTFHSRFWIIISFWLIGLPFAFRRDPYLVALSMVTLRMALTSRRFVPLFAITATPMVACAIGFFVRQAIRAWPRLGRADVAFATTGIGAVICFWFWSSVQIYPLFLQRWTEWNLYPEAAVKYMQAIEPAPTRVLNYYNWGGYLMLHAPQFKLFIDGRANTVYDDEMYIDYLSILSAGPGFHARVAKRPAEIALLPTGRPPTKALTQPPSNWQVIYSDHVATILLPPGSPLIARPPQRSRLPDAKRVLAGHPDLLLQESRAISQTGQIDRGIELLEQALEMNPLLTRAYGQLAQFHAAKGDFDAADAVIDRAIAFEPRQIKRLYQLKGTIYQSHGQLERAIEAFRKAVPGGPFSSPRSMRARIRELEEKLLEKRAYEGIE